MLLYLLMTYIDKEETEIITFIMGFRLPFYIHSERIISNIIDYKIKKEGLLELGNYKLKSISVTQ